MRHRFDLGYKTWVHHGEPALPLPPPVIDNTRQHQMSDMTALHNDLSYIPPNNEHNEPTQGDIGETSNEATQATRNEFEELYASANEELYPGCDYVTRLDFMAKFTYFKVKGKLTDSIFNEMLEFFQNVFPISKGYKLPPSYYAIKKTFKTIGLGYESIHACEHDCCLFRGDDNKDLDFCPVCNTSRWKDSNTPGKKVPKKVLRYFSIIPRLQRLYKSSHTAKEMIWHATGKCTEPSKMQHPVDGRAWKNFDTKYPDFAKEPRNVGLGLAADGFYNTPCFRSLYDDCVPDKICSTNLMEDDMLKAQIKVVDILCDLELIYPSALFDIMIHLVIHLPLEALEGEPIRPRWMFSFERYMKKLKGYVRNKAKLEGSIAEGYVAKETLTFSSHYFRDVTTKFNRPDRNMDPPPPTCQFQIRQRHVDNDKDPEVVDGVRYVVHIRDERRTTQNSDICSHGPDGEMHYGQLQEILDFKYLLFKVVLFRVKWFDTRNQGRKVKCLVLRNNMTQIDTREDDPDIIHFDNSSDLPLSTSLNDLDNATLHIDGQLTEVDAPPDIIDVVDEDDDIIDDEDPLPHDVADSDDEDLINVDDDGVEKMSADVARSHGGDGGGDDRPPSHVVPTGCGGCFANKGKGKRKPNLGGRGAGRLNTRDKTRNLSLKEIAVAKGPVPINFEQGDKQTLNPLGPHAAHWSNYIGEVVRSVPLYYPSWEKVPKERKAAIISEIGTLFDLRPHMDSSRWTEISEGINMHLQKAYNTNKASFKAKYWKADPTTGSYDLEAIRRARPEEITAAEWDKYIKFWNDPKNLARAAQNRLNRQKSVVTSRQGSRSLARLRDEMRQASDTQEYPSLIDTFWRTHTVDGVFPKDEDRRIYEEMKRLEATGEYTEDEINALARGGKLRGHIPGVGRVLPSRATSRPSMPAPDKSLKSMHRKVDFMMSLFRSDSKYSDMFKEFESGGASGSGGCGDDEEGGDDEDGDSDD
ncbi:reverse transcriptase domain-containing protein [Tanacetum coccineum]|uniref:Reverse transcriptase domain-containing protein n=2 Tax=Tanacetum coccineum TaxID=301880 RepID=A0ABQ5HQ55_9ASTR